MIVERRDQVLITSLRPDARDVSAFFSRKPSMNGPFQTERATGACPPLLRRVTTAQDHAVRPLVLPGLVTLRRDARRGDPMDAAVGPAAVRMVDRILGDAAGVRPDAEPAA